LFQHLPHLAGHHAGELLLARREQVAHAAEHVATLRGGSAAPALEALLGRPDGALDVFPPRPREKADQILRVCGVAILEIFASARLDPLAANEVPKLLSHHSSLGRRRAPLISLRGFWSVRSRMARADGHGHTSSRTRP